MESLKLSSDGKKLMDLLDKNLSQVIIPDSVIEIACNALKACTSIKSIHIPSSVKIIGEGAFRDCSSLETIYLPPSVEHIGWYAFCGCTSLLVEHHLIERLVELNANNAKGTPVFIEP